ncbi:hypothetical protein Scep_027888 [Stephania cephalantha]|uniref:Uncharacterized protein n=1 Tax=Stephania cephalantha TaxID=152367 RepID=A0AAP0E8V9_9MAGN
MELLRGLVSSPFPPAPSALPQEGGGVMPYIVRFPIIIESVGENRWILHPSQVYARRMTKIFKRRMITQGYGALMHKLRALGVRLDFFTNEAWNRYCEYWASVDFKARSEKASQNRKSEKGSLGTGPSKYTDGTRSFRTYVDVLALDKDEDDEVTPNDVFLHVDTKDHDGSELLRRRDEHTQATPDRPVDEKQLYYDEARECSKGNVYGLGSLSKRKRRYEDLGTGTSRDPMVRRSELDAVVQRLAQFEAFVQSHLGMRMDFGASTFQALPPPPPQEHHHQVGMDPTHSLQR